MKINTLFVFKFCLGIKMLNSCHLFGRDNNSTNVKCAINNEKKSFHKKAVSLYEIFLQWNLLSGCLAVITTLYHKRCN